MLVLLAPGGWRATWAGFAVASVVAWQPTAPLLAAAGSLPSLRTSTDDPSQQPSYALRRPALAALLAGAGSAAVWTFGPDLLTTSTGGPAPQALWGLLGAAGVAGAVSGDAVRRLGVSLAWTSAVAITAAATPPPVLYMASFNFLCYKSRHLHKIYEARKVFTEIQRDINPEDKRKIIRRFARVFTDCRKRRPISMAGPRGHYIQML